jgi:hypothetical protein
VSLRSRCIRLNARLLTVFNSTRDFRSGLDDNSIFGHLHKAQVYLDKARETQKNIEVWIAQLVAHMKRLTVPLFPRQQLIMGLYGGPRTF